MSSNPLTATSSLSKPDGYFSITMDLTEHDEQSDRDIQGEGYLPLESSVPRFRSRVVRRSNGRSMIKLIGLKRHGLSFLQDGFTTLVNSRWYIILLFFTTVYVLSWLFFGCVWATVVYVDGNSNRTCLENINSFSGAFLFSIELEMTIGFGYKYVGSDCHFGIFLLCVQCIVGLIIDAILLGLIVVKITRPRNRRKTIVFSKNAVIHERNGHKVLELRIADIRKSQLVECHVRLQLYWNKLVDEYTNRYEFQQFDLDVGYDTGRDRIILLTPVSIYHYIKEDSPLYGLTAAQLASSDLELVVILEGIVETTGLTAQALWSYTKEEIIYDREFVPMVTRRAGKWEVDYRKLSRTQPADIQAQSHL